MIDFFLSIQAKCGNMLRNSMIHFSNSTIRGSSYKGAWGIPKIDGAYSWCPSDGDMRPYLEIDLGKFVIDSMTICQLRKEKGKYEPGRGLESRGRGGVGEGSDYSNKLRPDVQPRSLLYLT